MTSEPCGECGMDRSSWPHKKRATQDGHAFIPTFRSADASAPITDTRLVSVKRKTTFDCAECGMLQEGPAFHPYWYCVLFKAGIDPRQLDPPLPAATAEAGLREAIMVLKTWIEDRAIEDKMGPCSLCGGKQTHIPTCPSQAVITLWHKSGLAVGYHSALAARKEQA